MPDAARPGGFRSWAYIHLPLDNFYSYLYYEGMDVGMQVTEPGEFVNTYEAAEILGMTHSRVCQMLRSGEMKGRKLGRRVWVIPRAEVDRIKAIPQQLGRPRTGS